MCLSSTEFLNYNEANSLLTLILFLFYRKQNEISLKEITALELDTRRQIESQKH